MQHPGQHWPHHTACTGVEWNLDWIILFWLIFQRNLPSNARWRARAIQRHRNWNLWKICAPRGAEKRMRGTTSLEQNNPSLPFPQTKKNQQKGHGTLALQKPAEPEEGKPKRSSNRTSRVSGCVWMGERGIDGYTRGKMNECAVFPFFHLLILVLLFVNYVWFPSAHPTERSASRDQLNSSPFLCPFLLLFSKQSIVVRLFFAHFIFRTVKSHKTDFLLPVQPNGKSGFV